MKILYGINTNGQGHINRARVFINELIKDGHNVHILFSGKKPPEYAYKITSISFYKKGLIDIYKDHKVDYMKTFQVNLTNLGELTKNRRDLIELAIEEDYDIIFTDYEPAAAVVGKELKKTVICIDHQHSAFHPANEIAPSKTSLRLGLKYANRLMVPYFSHCFCIDFVHEISKIADETLFPLIWKPEFNSYKISVSDHYLVYLARYNKLKMVEILSKFPDDYFIVYGFNQEESDCYENIQFKEPDREEFIKDLASCKGVITNGGFSLAWESCILNKLIWMIPHSNNYEQLTNVYRLKKLNRAFTSEKLTINEANEFFTEAERNEYEASEILPVIQPEVLMEQVYEEIEKHNKKERK